MSRVLLHHRLGADGALVENVHEVEARYLQVPAACQDCRSEPPATFSPPAGYSAAVVLVHSETCPALRSVLRKPGTR